MTAPPALAREQARAFNPYAPINVPTKPLASGLKQFGFTDIAAPVSVGFFESNLPRGIVAGGKLTPTAAASLAGVGVALAGAGISLIPRLLRSMETSKARQKMLDVEKAAAILRLPQTLMDFKESKRPTADIEMILGSSIISNMSFKEIDAMSTSLMIEALSRVKNIALTDMQVTRSRGLTHRLKFGKPLSAKDQRFFKRIMTIYSKQFGL